MITNKQIKTLAKSSYTNNVLNSKKVNRIVKLLNRNELKTYLKFLKSLEKSKTVNVLISKITMKNDVSNKLKRMFPDKKLEFTEDKSLIAGIRIVNNDDVYDFNLKNTFTNLVSYINQ